MSACCVERAVCGRKCGTCGCCQPVCVSCVSSETKDKPTYIEETLTRLTKTAYGKHKAKHKQ
jgi:hypothetical protein